jgi:hypothetical protein
VEGAMAAFEESRRRRGHVLTARSRVVSRAPAAKGSGAHPFAIRAGGCILSPRVTPLGDQT